MDASHRGEEKVSSDEAMLALNSVCEKFGEDNTCHATDLSNDADVATCSAVVADGDSATCTSAGACSYVEGSKSTLKKLSASLQQVEKKFLVEADQKREKERLIKDSHVNHLFKIYDYIFQSEIDWKGATPEGDSTISTLMKNKRFSVSVQVKVSAFCTR